MLPAIFTRAPCAALASCLPGLMLAVMLLGTCSGQLMDEAGIVPNDYISHGYQAALRAKRVMPVSSGPCSSCVSTYSPDSCLRCWLSTARDVPFHATKRASPDSYPLETEKRFYSYRRQQRASGCACCYHSRFQNMHCCRLCQRSTSKRSSPPLPAAGSVADDEAAYDTPAYGADPDCFCCALGGLDLSLACCSRCLARK